MKISHRKNSITSNLRGLSSYPAMIIILSVIIIGILVALFAGSYRKHILESKIYEAGRNLRDIYDGEFAYYNELKSKRLTPQFVSAPFTPVAPPTKHKRKGNWAHPAWKAINLAPKEPVQFVYRVEAKGVGMDDAKFTAFAYGDLDGDGVTSMFKREGTVRDGEPTMGGGLYKSNENRFE